VDSEVLHIKGNWPFASKVNIKINGIEHSKVTDPRELAALRSLIEDHRHYSDSEVADWRLAPWAEKDSKAGSNRQNPAQFEGASRASKRNCGVVPDVYERQWCQYSKTGRHRVGYISVDFDRPRLLSSTSDLQLKYRATAGHTGSYQDIPGDVDICILGSKLFWQQANHDRELFESRSSTSRSKRAAAVQ
jgi:hypothetical protein